MDSVDEKLRKLTPVKSKQSAILWQYYLTTTGLERQALNDLLDLILNTSIGKDFSKKILLPPPQPQDCTGTYPLGVVIYPERPFAVFGLREDEWCKHVLLSGMSGAGKTNAAFQIVSELNRKNKPFLVFDWKRGYRDLRQLPAFKDLQVYTAGQKITPLHFNPLIPPPSVSPTQWLLRLLDIVGHAFFTGEGVGYLLRDAIHHYYLDFGVYTGSKKYPTFFMIQDYIRKKPLTGRMGLWKASTMRVLARLTFPGSLGDMLNVAHNEVMHQILTTNTVIELDALADADKVFLTEVLILWIYEMRKNEGKREQFKHALVVEEAHHVLSEKKEQSSGDETVMETALRQIREFGEAVIVIDQEPSKLSNSIKANTYTKLTFNLGYGRDIKDISEAMMLTPEQTQYIDLLKVGQAIVKLKGRFHQPALIQFPKVEIHKGLITDEDLKNTKKLL